MPPIASAFCGSADRAMQILQALESLRLSSPMGSLTRTTLIPPRMEFAYEAAFLRIFTQWESLLEEATLRYMCGYTYAGYAPTFPSTASKQPDLATARVSLFGSGAFLLWHNPSKNASRLAGWVTNCPVEVVMRSTTSWLETVSAVRHRIAHDSADSRQKFDAATIALAGRRFRGASVGRFLRGGDPFASTRRIHQFVSAFKGLALQIAP
jgi:hypothetical protein